MYHYLKDFGKGAFFSLAFNAVLSLIFLVIFILLFSNIWISYMEVQPGFVLVQFSQFLYFFTIIGFLLPFILFSGALIFQAFPYGLIGDLWFLGFFGLPLFGLLFVLFERFGGKKPWHAFSAMAITIAIPTISLLFLIPGPESWLFNGVTPESIAFIFNFMPFLVIACLCGLALFLFRILKENKKVILIMSLGALLALSNYTLVTLIIYVFLFTMPAWEG